MRIFLLLFMIFALSYARQINAIALTIDQEIITEYEISKLMQEKKISKQEAINELIDDKLELAEIKKYKIFVNEFELENEMNKMLMQSNSSLNQLKANLSKKDFQKAKENFKKQLEKRRLYEALVSAYKVDTSEQGLRSYYDSNPDDFVIFTQISVEVLSSSEASELEKLKTSKRKAASIQSESVILSPQNSDIRLLAFLSRLKPGEYTPIMQNNDIFMMYKVKNKEQAQTLPFDEIKSEITNLYASKQREEYLSDYFNKLRAKADIKYLR
ncbi:peptidylprolyl isomerase [Campylobacter avium]|uniref:peptidylprolyl isomerase n=1 Tax=Campylobacter avium TaxID=522485 RepID=UPI00255BB420|nr:peptidylprolyl isomerase [Campylobacter avium]